MTEAFRDDTLIREVSPAAVGKRFSAGFANYQSRLHHNTQIWSRGVIDPFQQFVRRELPYVPRVDCDRRERRHP